MIILKFHDFAELASIDIASWSSASMQVHSHIFVAFDKPAFLLWRLESWATEGFSFRKQHWQLWVFVIKLLDDFSKAASSKVFLMGLDLRLNMLIRCYLRVV